MLPAASAPGPASLACSLDALDFRPATRQAFFAPSWSSRSAGRRAFGNFGRSAIAPATSNLNLLTIMDVQAAG
jgi:hypothetical protein